MTNRQSRRRYRKKQDRRVCVFSELNRDLRPGQIARIITTAGLEQARREAEAHADHPKPDGLPVPSDEEVDHV